MPKAETTNLQLQHENPHSGVNGWALDGMVTQPTLTHGSKSDLLRNTPVENPVERALVIDGTIV